MKVIRVAVFMRPTRYLSAQSKSIKRKLEKCSFFIEPSEILQHIINYLVFHSMLDNFKSYAMGEYFGQKRDLPRP